MTRRTSSNPRYDRAPDNIGQGSGETDESDDDLFHPHSLGRITDAEDENGVIFSDSYRKLVMSTAKKNSGDSSNHKASLYRKTGSGLSGRSRQAVENDNQINPSRRPYLGSKRSSSRSGGLGSKESSRRSGLASQRGSSRSSKKSDCQWDHDQHDWEHNRDGRERNNRRSRRQDKGYRGDETPPPSAKRGQLQHHGESSQESSLPTREFCSDKNAPCIDEQYDALGPDEAPPFTDISDHAEPEREEGKKRKRKKFKILIVFVVVVSVMVIAGYCVYRYKGTLFPPNDQVQIPKYGGGDNSNKDLPSVPAPRPPTSTMPVDIAVHPAPYDLADLCSLANIEKNGVEVALFECKKACKAAECCYGDNPNTGISSCIDSDEVNRKMCAMYSPHCDMLYGRMNGIESRKIGPAQMTVADSCTVEIVQASDAGRYDCEEACRPGWCCFASIFAQKGFIIADDHFQGFSESMIGILPDEMVHNYVEAASCFEGNEEKCGGFAPCLALTAPYMSTSSPDDERPPIPVPPENLPTLCSSASIKTMQGQIDCQAACLPGKCCGSRDTHMSCFNSDEATCGLYGPCQALLDAAGGDGAEDSPPPPPPPYLERVCSYEILGRVEFRSMCENICLPGKCCMDGSCGGRSANQTTSAEEEGEGDACTPYQSCRNLLPLPPPPSNLVELCSADNPNDLKGCEEACLPASCCLSSSSDSCYDIHSEACGSYSACGTLLQKDDGDKPVTLSKPSSKTELSTKCSNSNVESMTGRAECEAICQLASCCFSPEDAINCFTENEEVCGEWASCVVLYDEGEDEVVEPPLMK